MRICADCLKAEDWKNRFNLEKKKSVCCCSFCGKKRKTVDFSIFSESLSSILSLFVKSENGTNLVELIERDFEIFSNENVAKRAFQYVLKEYSSVFSINDTVEYSDEVSSELTAWSRMKKSVKNEYRFFPSSDPENESWSQFFTSYAEIKKGEVFFRGRLNENADQPYKKTKDLGMPPQEKARAGRVNPYGIPCLYLTDQADTTIYELRATHGDKISIGRFVVKENLKIVDFNYRPLLLDSIYDGKDRLQDAVREFLLKKQIGLDLSKPVRRYDVKEIEYVPTQYICEYIKLNGADGVMFNSAVRHGAKNLVLFKSDKVKCVSVDVKTVDEPEMHFCSKS